MSRSPWRRTIRTLGDRVGAAIAPRSHVRITHPLHSDTGRTGTIVRVDLDRRKVWVALPDGRTVSAGHRSVEVIN